MAQWPLPPMRLAARWNRPPAISYVASVDGPEGLGMRRDGEQVIGAGRLKRTIRLGTTGPGVEIDATALGRIRFRRV